jgi:SAM-dependent methyltransferase
MPADAAHWQAERQYWHDALQGWMSQHYGLALHPLQSDDATVPQPQLIDQIQNRLKCHPDVYFATGYRTMLDYLRELHDQRVAPQRFERILEFGVGLGRLIRHFLPFGCQRFGCDVTADCLEFTQRVLGNYVTLSASELTPPLPYADTSFDFIYANSVFTHIQMAATPQWIVELRRVLRPGGVLIATVFDANHYLRHLGQREFDQIEHGPGYLEWGASDVSQRFMYMTPRKLHETWSRHFHVVQLYPHFLDQSHLLVRPR